MYEADFTQIDYHAVNVPEVYTRSVETLAKYLCASCYNGLEKALVIFRWIKEHIEYNILKTITKKIIIKIFILIFLLKI